MVLPAHIELRKRKRKLRRPWSWWIRAVIATYLFGRLVYYAADHFMRWMRLPSYSSYTERIFRENRFPSVEQRVRLYMGQWYLPPCEGTPKILATAVPVKRIKNYSEFWSNTVTKSVNDIDWRLTAVKTQQNITVSSIARPDQVFYFNKDDLFYCYKQKDWSIRFYCQDARLSMQGAMKDGAAIPVFVEFTDHSYTSWTTTTTGTGAPKSLVVNPDLPVIKKIRTALSKAESEEIMNNDNSSACQDLSTSPVHQNYRNPILWLLNEKRHYKYAMDIPRYDIPWSKKKNSAIFRGELTGLQYDSTLSAHENCERLPRCRLVYRNANSNLVDARITNTFDRIPEMLSGTNMTAPKLRRFDMLQHKGLIILEGNDVSSGLKWSMVSNSVILMPPPTFSSWAMEELLEPWGHYIPLLPDLSDTEAKVQWMLENQEESKRIAHRAKLWVLDLYFHRDAKEDAKRINEEILRRYRLLFDPSVVRL